MMAKAHTPPGTRSRARDGIVAHTIPREGGAPALELLEAVPDGNARGAPLLLVHGAFGGAWMWREVFMPVFAAAGRRVVAFSIRGHGASEGWDRLRETSLAEYVEDVRRALRVLPEPPVVIAHSLGGLLSQMLIGREEMRGLVLCASLPPEGMIFTTPRLAMTDPTLFTEAFLGSVTKTHGPIAMAGFQVLFSDGLPPHEIARHARRMQPESPRALLDAHASPPVLSAAAFRIPTLVVRRRARPARLARLDGPHGALPRRRAPHGLRHGTLPATRRRRGGARGRHPRLARRTGRLRALQGAGLRPCPGSGKRGDVGRGRKPSHEG
jgi:pimeloyl-ACP methyl ester carboxylesterase